MGQEIDIEKLALALIMPAKEMASESVEAEKATGALDGISSLIELCNSRALDCR